MARATDESLWSKIARHFRRKRSAQTGESDDMRRAGDREPDKDAAFEQMLNITNRSGRFL